MKDWLQSQQKRERLGYTNWACISYERLATELSEREATLHQMRMHQLKGLATESTEEREARLHQLSMCQHERLATDLSKKREARLHQMSMPQHERLAKELSKEREARHHQMSTHQHGQLKSASMSGICWPTICFWSEHRLVPLQALHDTS